MAGSRIVRVTSLADSGDGTLRAALADKWPRVIVFDVGGVIDLKSDLRISAANVTIAGQTAPSPGILLRGAKVRVVAADVVIQHVSIHPIFRARPGFVGEIDAINVGECEKCKKQVADVRLENISAGWANDEVVGLWGDKLERVTIRNSIIAEGLHEAGHPKVRHSMGLLVGAGVQAVEVVGNLFVSNGSRNPVLGGGASGFVANNYVYNPGAAAMHLYHDRADLPTRVSFIGNMIKGGPSTNPRMTALTMPASLANPPAAAQVFAKDNYCCSGSAEASLAIMKSEIPFAISPPVTSVLWKMMPAADVPGWALRYAGSRPADRSPLDARIVSYVKAAGGKIIDSPEEVGGYPEVASKQRQALVPDDPFGRAPKGLSAGTRIEAWLCLRHFEVGGPPTSECHDQPAAITSALGGHRRTLP